MFRLTMFDDLNAVSAIISNRMLDLKLQYKILLTSALSDFVSMARLGDSDSVLVVGCGKGSPLLGLAKTVGHAGRVILCLDTNHELLQSLSRSLREHGLRQYARLCRADVLNTATDVLASSLANQNLPTTFDSIFAVDVLPATYTERVRTLRRFASLSTSTNARMLVTFRDGEGQLGEIAGAVRFDNEGQVHYRTSWMLETEWARAEEGFQALATDAGLRVVEMRRVGFHGPEAALWADESQRIALMAGGDNPTVASKNEVKLRVANVHNDGIKMVYDEDVVVGACLVAVLVL